MKKILSFSILLFVLFLYLFFNCGKVIAGAEHNVAGWAWSENIGWISFNSTNCDSDGNGITDTGNYLQCPVGQPISNYGVSLITTNIGEPAIFLSGWAWSENIGWISFNSTDVVGCPGGTCWPRLSSAGGPFLGWTRTLSYGDGWDGWLSLSCLNRGPCATSNYKISLIGNDFTGFAWGGDVLGWVSFNCLNMGACGSSPYKVYIGNTSPQANNLTFTFSVKYCNTPFCTFSWTFFDPDTGNINMQSKFQIQIDNNSTFVSPTIDRTVLIGTSGISPNTNTLQILFTLASDMPGTDRLSYNTTYYWRVQVWDKLGGSSGWISGASFTTPVAQ